MMDPLATLNNLTGIESAVSDARSAVDGAYRHPALRRKGGLVAAEVSLRSAVASASLQTSILYPREDVRSGTVLDAVVQGSLRIHSSLPVLADRWESAPAQVLARLHVLGATGIHESDSLGRPVVPLDRVCGYVVARSGDPLIRAAVVHGEMLALNPFPGVNGLIARAAARLTLIASGFDPRGLVLAEEIHLSREPEYRGSSLAFASGTPDGIRSWLKHCALSATLGAESVASVAEVVTEASQ
ncbi:MAG TPA: hypothetical protein VFC19_50480 [Candidatus Limnocylindrales bacterium]|nr:hypothetical protein [Candidatus Limnocylindrales bacterium]